MKSVFTDEYVALLQRLVLARRQANLTQRELASRINRPQSFVSKFERGERRLDVLEFVKVCHFLNIDPGSVVSDIEKNLFDQ